MAEARQIVADNVAHVRERIAAAAIRSGRDPQNVTLVAVTKYVDARTTALIREAGCLDLGESRPQELWSKASEAPLAGVRWHLVGALQRNKARRTLPLVSLIHSVASEKLLATLDELAVEFALAPAVLLEVNCSGDIAKQGFSADQMHRLLSRLAKLRRVRVKGLMTMAALEGGTAVARANFAALRKLRDELVPSCPPNVALDELSMGMSDDFEAAIAEGGTIVRVGSLLFEGLKR